MKEVTKADWVDAMLAPTFKEVYSLSMGLINRNAAIRSKGKQRVSDNKTTKLQEAEAAAVEHTTEKAGELLISLGGLAQIAGGLTANLGHKIIERGSEAGLKIRDIDLSAANQINHDEAIELGFKVIPEAPVTA